VIRLVSMLAIQATTLVGRTYINEQSMATLYDHQFRWISLGERGRPHLDRRDRPTQTDGIAALERVPHPLAGVAQGSVSPQVCWYGSSGEQVARTHQEGRYPTATVRSLPTGGEHLPSLYKTRGTSDRPLIYRIGLGRQTARSIAQSERVG
jgi:hypothetical protein